MRDIETAQLRALAELIALLSQLVHAIGFTAKLKPAQWATLRYLQKVNASARTLTEFSRANAITKGAASQMIKALQERGLVSFEPSTEDRRSKLINLTELGRRYLDDDPLNQIVAALRKVEPGSRKAFAETIEVLLRDPFVIELNNPKARQRLAKTRKSLQRTPIK